MYKKACWLYNKVKITLQVHKFPLRIVNDKVIMVIEHPNLFNPLFEIYLKCSQIMQQQMAHARHINGVSAYAQTIRRPGCEIGLGPSAPGTCETAEGSSEFNSRCPKGTCESR